MSILHDQLREKGDGKWEMALSPFPFSLFPIALITIVSLFPLSTLAQTSSVTPANACIEAMHKELTREQDIYRSVLFGRRKASDVPLSTTKYDKEGKAWIKTGTNKWVTTEKGYENTQWSDTQMDSQVAWEGQDDATAALPAWKFRPGLFETKRASTSDLIPPITQAYRAFQCRLAAVCENVRQSHRSETPNENGLLDVSIPGCEVRMKPINACAFDSSGAFSQYGIPAETIVHTYCDPLVEKMLSREEQMLKMVVTYDAAYRSLLQLAGSVELVLGPAQDDLLAPIRQTLPLVGQLSRIPCFLAQCNE